MDTFIRDVKWKTPRHVSLDDPAVVRGAGSTTTGSVLAGVHCKILCRLYMGWLDGCLGVWLGFAFSVLALVT